MNNEPVAWFYAYPDDIEEKFLCSNSELIETMNRKGYTLTPLYTHPASKAKDRFSNYESICLQCGTTIYKPFKELTDERITAISKKIFKDYKNFHHYQIDFARAVIKEVSGK